MECKHCEGTGKQELNPCDDLALLYCGIGETLSRQCEECGGTGEVKCDFNDGNTPSRWFCGCDICADFIEEWEEQGKEAPRAPQEWYIARD